MSPGCQDSTEDWRFAFQFICVCVFLGWGGGVRGYLKFVHSAFSRQSHHPLFTIQSDKPNKPKDQKPR